MNKHLIVLGIAVLLICVNLCGCTDETNNQDNSINNELDRFLGTWICDKEWYNYTVIFTSDRKYESHNHIWGVGVYDIEDEQLILKMANSNIIFTMFYKFSNNDEFILIYEDGSSSIFEKTEIIYFI